MFYDIWQFFCGIFSDWISPEWLWHQQIPSPEPYNAPKGIGKSVKCSLECGNFCGILPGYPIFSFGFQMQIDLTNKIVQKQLKFSVTGISDVPP